MNKTLMSTMQLVSQSVKHQKEMIQSETIATSQVNTGQMLLFLLSYTKAWSRLHRCWDPKDYVHKVQLALRHLSSAEAKLLHATIGIYIMYYSHVCLIIRLAALCAWNIGSLCIWCLLSGFDPCLNHQNTKNVQTRLCLRTCPSDIDLFPCSVCFGDLGMGEDQCCSLPFNL